MSQQEAGLAALEECAEAGFVGARGCDDPSCEPYGQEMRARGACSATTYEQIPGVQIVDEVLVEIPPLHPQMIPYDYYRQGGGGPAAMTFLPASETHAVTRLDPITLVAPMPSITPLSPQAVGDLGPAEGPLCGFNRWVDANPVLAAGLALGAYLLLSRKGR
jgi:hypothetical protein